MPKILRLLAMATLLSACSSDKSTDNTCVEDLDCVAPGTRCDIEAQQCVCGTDEACADGEFCNLAGSCQKKSGCSRNSECLGDNEFCDLKSGRCLEGPKEQLDSACGLVSHCPLRTICDGSQCIVGCHDDGDCPLGEVCYDDGTGRACATGTGLCSEDAFCDYGEQCQGNECKKDRRGPYCRGCSRRTALNPEPCDDARNFCLINSAETGGFRQFCGVDCSLGQECPNGYDCNFVVILTDDVCTTNAQCQCDRDKISFATRTCTVSDPCVPVNSDGSPAADATFCVNTGHLDCNPGGEGDASCLVPRGDTAGFCTCDDDSDCADGGTCVGGQCCGGDINLERQCRVGEARVTGFCSCATDADCPRDSCDPSRGACAITGNPCVPGNGDCGPIPCVNGGCRIGQNCAPIQGLACSEVNPP